MPFVKAEKGAGKARMAIYGPAGSGKTWTALAIATALGRRVAVLDTENGSASKYADIFQFDVMCPQSYDPRVYIEAIGEAEKAGYDVIVLDSLSHEWTGAGGALEMVNSASGGNKYTAWKDVTPLHNQMIERILRSPAHVIATMRTKKEYVLEDVNGKKVPRLVGTGPIQRDQVEYEFDLVGQLDEMNTLKIIKSRCPALTGRSFIRAGADVAEIIRTWLVGSNGKAEAPKSEPKPAKKAKEPTPAPAPVAPEPPKTEPAAPPAPTPETPVHPHNILITGTTVWAAAQMQGFKKAESFRKALEHARTQKGYEWVPVSLRDADNDSIQMLYALVMAGRFDPESNTLKAKK